MIKAYWLRILICALVGAGLGLLLAVFTPPKYEAVFAVLVDSKQLSGPSRQLTAADENVQDLVDFGRGRSVSTQVEMLTGLGTLQTAAQKVAAQRNMSMSSPDSELNPINLEQRVSVVAQNDSDVVTVRVKMSSEELARDVATEIYNAFYDQNNLIAKENADRAIKSLEKQKTEVEAKLRDLDNQATELKRAFTAPNIDAQVQSDVVALKDLEQVRDNAQIDLETQQSRITRLRSDYASAPDTIESSSTNQYNPTLQTIESQLASARADLQQLLAKYTPEREEVKLAQARIANLELQARQIKGQIKAASTRTVNPNKQELQRQIFEASSGIKAFAGRLQAAQQAVDAKKAEIQKLPEIQQKLQAILRDQAAQERLYQGYAERLDSLRAADSGRSTVTSLITPAISNPNPVSPNYVLNISLGFVIGLGFGLFWSISTEARRSPIRTLAQLNRLALQPAYRTIPELRVPFRGVDRAPAEAFESLLVNFARSQKKGYRMGFVGTMKGAGSTVTALNVAVSAARTGSSVLIVEGDPSGPIAKRLGKLGPGPVSDKIKVYDGGLTGSHSDHELNLPQQLVDAIASYDLVVFDFLPARQSSDAVRYASEMDEVVLLARVGQTRSVDFLQVQQALVEAGCKTLTIALSRVPEQSDDVALLETGSPDAKALTS